jgi:glutathione peroxidase
MNPSPAAVGHGMSDLLDQSVTTLLGEQTTLGGLTAGRAALVVNVASRCGLTPQYEGLEQLQREYGDRGFTVVGVPCNQFKGQEPGSAEAIAEFCSATYGVTFPLTEKVDVNGPERHPIYAALVDTPDASGRTGDIAWNFEKFLLDSDGSVVARFDPSVEPEDPSLVSSIEAQLH